MIVLEDGYFVGFVIFKDVLLSVIIVQEEIFGLVLVVMKVENFIEVLEIVNGINFVLIGGLYFCIFFYIEWVKEEFEVGNLYINCGIMGAIVFW